MIGQGERQEAVCALLRQSILELCKASFSYEGNDVDIDGILCISTKRSSGVENVVVKIHDQLWSAKHSKEAGKSFGSLTGQKAHVQNSTAKPFVSRPRSLPQRFETKRKTNTTLVSLLSGAVQGPKFARSTNGSPIQQLNGEKSMSDVNKNDSEDVHLKAMLEDSYTPKSSQNSPKSRNIDENQGLDQGEKTNPEKLIPMSSNSSTVTKPKRKSGLDAIVSNLSETARLQQTPLEDTGSTAELEKQVRVVHIVPDEADMDFNENDCMDIDTNANNGNSNIMDPKVEEFQGIKPHSNIDDPNTIFICENCKMCIESRQEYIIHRAQCNAKGTMSSQQQQHICRLCDREFADFNALSLHTRIHSVSFGKQDSVWKGKPLTCGLCKLVLRSKRNLQDHMRDHMRDHAHITNISPFSCVTCECVFPEFETFKQHREDFHQAANNCRCEICDLFFTFKEYKTHELECINGKQMRSMPPLNSIRSDLEYLNRADNQDNALKMELAINDQLNVTNSENDQYENSNSIDYSDRQSLDGSLADENSSINLSPGQGVPCRNETIDVRCLGPYRCQSCFTVFEQFSEYEVHNHEMHSRFVCSFCAQSFASRRNLTRHARRHTGIKPYQCPTCDSTYTRDDDLKKHMVRVHDIKPPPKIRAPTIKHASPIINMVI